MWNRVKSELFLLLAFFVKLFGLRSEAWYREHLSRQKHRRKYVFSTEFDYEAYGREILMQAKEPDTSDFVELSEKAYQRKADDPKLLAFYLPQFHQIEENNLWHGQGFTEWSNVCRCKPQFIGHHQPQLPIDLGYYDLAQPKIMYRQVELARLYGIYGFCFHYYWFSGGKRLLETPLFNWLENKDLNLPFCLCWANENWSKLWDGGNREVLMRQESRSEDAEDFFRGILPFWQDERYIRLDNKPLLIIYRPNLFTREAFLKFGRKLRSLAEEHGLNGVYIAIMALDYFEDMPGLWEVDAMLEFPPMRITHLRDYVVDGNPLNPDFKGFVYSMEKAVNNGEIFTAANLDRPLYRGLFPAWDNSARKAYSNASVYLQSPQLYGRWLEGLIKWTKENHPPDKQLIFINAWNEWAEGAHLEPDTKYGYAYLQKTKEILENFSKGNRAST